LNSFYSVSIRYPNCICVVYTGDTESEPKLILKKAQERFTIQLDIERTKFIYLKTRFLVLDKYYPVFTLLGQSVGSVLVGFEAMFKFIPNIYFETTGYAFTYPLFYYIANVPVCCYTHYPTISTDMLEAVSQQHPAFNNRTIISSSRLLTKLKMIYYKIFASLYSWCGRCSCCIMVNSSWTFGHINKLWSMTYKTQVIYPPCDVKSFDPIFASQEHDKNFYISSVAQFRPEKNHQLQIRAFSKFLNNLKEQNEQVKDMESIKLVLIGSCRDEQDQQRVEMLKNLAKSLKIEDKVEFKLNFKFETLLDLLSKSAVGIHSMINEHFGIST
jgi:alpha-1,2-mannosyltransferase